MTTYKELTGRPRALVTGATGFIGSHLTMALLSAGWEVHVFIRAESDLSSLGAMLSRIHCHVIELDAEIIGEKVSQLAPDVVFHLAAYFSAQHQSKEISSIIESNITYGALLLEASTACRVRNFIATSTSWSNWKENDLSPVCLYAASKNAFDQIARFYESAYDLKVVTLSLSDTYGPGDPRRKILNLLLAHLDSSDAIELSPGHQRMDFVFIEDVVGAFMRIAGLLLDNAVRESLDGRYDVSSGKHTSLRDLVQLIERCSGGKLCVEWDALPYRSREVFEPVSTGDAVPGWRAKVDLETGIRSLLEKNRSQRST